MSDAKSLPGQQQGAPPPVADPSNKAPSSVLVLFAHPAPEGSRVNRALVEALRELEGVTFHDLYAAYPDFAVDVQREQALLLAHDFIVLQHPFRWYSGPALLKEWMDQVLAHGWAYGQGGTQLQGKQLWQVLSTGGPAEAYRPEGYNRFPMETLLTPFEQTARLCGMHWLPPLIFHGAHKCTPDQITVHAQDYRARLIRAVAGQDPSTPH